jgi:hypothetical protein
MPTAAAETRFRIEACNPSKDVAWFTVHGFTGVGKRPRVIETARSMRDHMEPVWTVRIVEIDDEGERVVWKE